MYLDPVQGVNPRLMEAVCFVCGETHATGVALIGAHKRVDVCDGCGVTVYGGISHTRPCPKCKSSSVKESRQIGDNERIPDGVQTCSKCEEYMKQGIIFISVKDEDADKKDPYRTGGWCVVKEEAVRRLMRPPELLEAVLKKRMCFVQDTVWDRLGLPRTPTATGGTDAVQSTEHPHPG